MLTFLGYKDRYFIFLKTSYRVLMATVECGCERQNREQLLVKLKIWTILRSND